MPKTPPASSDFSTTLPFKLCWAWRGSLCVNIVGSACKARTTNGSGTLDPPVPPHLSLFSRAMGQTRTLQNVELGTP